MSTASSISPLSFSLLSREAASAPCRTCCARLVTLVGGIREAVLWIFAQIADFFSSLCCCRSIPFSPISSPVSSEAHLSLSVNGARLKDAPCPIDLSLLRFAAEQASPPVRAREILAHFDRIFQRVRSHERVFVDAHGMRGKNDSNAMTKEDARGAIETGYILFVERRGYGTNYHDFAAENTDPFLKGIALELRNPEVPEETKKIVLETLAGAGHHCPPRKYQDAERSWRRVTNQIETIEEALLQLLQQAKEDLFVNYYWRSSEPASTLNYIRKIAGKSLGLSQDPVYLKDCYMGIHDARGTDNRIFSHTTKGEFCRAFRSFWTPSNILRLMKESLNERTMRDPDFRQELGAFLQNEIQRHIDKGEVPDSENPTAPYIDENYYLTDAGVTFLLAHFHFLNHRRGPTGHLVKPEIKA